MEDCRANRELGHLQGRTNDGLNVANVDLACNIQNATRSAFDNVTRLMANGGFHREELVRMGVHGGAEEMEREVPIGDKAVGVNAREKTRQVLVVEERGRI